jgi:hypothetical protein
MTLVIALNIIGCLAVITGIVGSLAWAIRTQHRNEPPTVGARVMAEPPLQPRPTRDPRVPRRDPRPVYEAG